MTGNDILFWGSVLALLALACLTAIQRRNVRAVIWTAPVLGCYVALLHAAGLISLPFGEGPTARGGSEEPEGTIVFLLYLAMLVGMLSHYLYARFDGPPKRERFRLGRLIAPVFVSPIVFLPLASILGSIEASHRPASHLMLFLVAFENGFFWREFFANRLKAQTVGEHL